MKIPTLCVALAITAPARVQAATPTVPAEATAIAAHSPARYVDVSSYLRSDADYEAWFTFERQLRRDFDDICGDTFCEGDFSNIESLRYICSVNGSSGRIGACTWTFAASDESIDPKSGRIASRAMHWQCRSPLAYGTTVETFLAAMRVAHPLYAPLPGSDRTLYDGLIDCL